MYHSVLTGIVCFAIGYCTPAIAQCTTCGNNNAAAVESFPSYAIEGQYVGTQPMNGQFAEGQIVQQIPVEGQWTDGSIVSYDRSYSESSIVYGSQDAAINAASYPEVVTTQSHHTRTYSSYPVQDYSNQGVPVQTVAYNANASMGVDRVLSVVNRKRRRAGLPPLEMDPALMTVAQQKSANRANRRITGHDNLPKGGAAVEGVGYAHGYSNLDSQFNTCYLYSTGYRRAGAAISYDGSGRAYYTLLLR